MIDKEIFDQLKSNRKDKSIRKKAINLFKKEINAKLMFGSSEKDGFLSDNDRIGLLKQLEILEINEVNVRKNVNNSNSYEFVPSKNYKLK
jgi:hypothetical protein